MNDDHRHTANNSPIVYTDMGFIDKYTT